ncbi:MAG TPA: efflux RND transporter periplasmic adaptor subunit [Desulfitobacteriaceae bacterium]|nr:efflux RND transporter periplasmic adaptor subunit [Desulfitobacteriaceae bacterium]
MRVVNRMVRNLIVTIFLVLVFLSGGCGSTEEQGEEKYTPVEVVPAAVQTLVETTAFSGKVYSDREVSLVPKIPGKVTAVNVQVGDQVQAGEVLLTLDTQDLQKAVDQAALGVSIAEGNYQRAKEQLDLAKTNLERQRKLYEAGAISQSQLEDLENLASETPLKLAQTQWDQAKLSLQQAEDALNNAVLTAPVTGSVCAVNVKYGEMAGSVQAAVTITDLSSIYVSLNVPENIVNSLTAGQDAKVVIASAGNAELKGKVASIASSSDAKTQLYTVKVSLENENGLVKPGMFAKVELPTLTKADVLTVNSESVVLKNGKNTVFVVEGDKAVAKEVVTGLDSGDYIEITQGLQAGEKVISKGQTLVEPEGKVKIVGGNAS